MVTPLKAGRISDVGNLTPNWESTFHQKRARIPGSNDNWNALSLHLRISLCMNCVNLPAQIPRSSLSHRSNSGLVFPARLPPDRGGTGPRPAGLSHCTTVPNTAEPQPNSRWRLLKPKQERLCVQRWKSPGDVGEM